MNAADIKDVMGDVPIQAHAPPAKKQKVIEKRPDGMTRELYALWGERAPPIAITENKFKGRPKWSSKQRAHPWERSAFNNPARPDGLLLRHWKRREDTGPISLATPADSNVASENDVEEKEKAMRVEAEYPYAKFNVKVSVPEYTPEQYQSHLKNDDWTKEETDYLVNLALEYDLRWIVIWDRYEYQPSEAPKADENSMAVTVQAKQRSMEDLKARYYDVAAKTMALNQPLSSMSTTEFELHEKMTKFDAELETTRKKLAETLFARSPEEVKEEEILLAELKRIVNNQEKFAQERKELYDRLSVPHSSGGATYKSSQDLWTLMQTLLSADKNKKRRSLAEGGLSSGTTPPNGPSQADRTHRQSISGPGDKRSSIAGSAGLGAGQKQLSARDEARFGISHNERSQSGTQFRHERINKLSQAKSNVLTQKIAAALTELGIPNRLTMPTAAVCDEFEKLVGSIHILLDVRKVSEKLENEIKVAKASMEDKAAGVDGKARAAEVPNSSEQPVQEDDDGEKDAEGEDEEEEEEEEEEVEAEQAAKEPENEEDAEEEEEDAVVEEKDEATMEDADENENENMNEENAVEEEEADADAPPPPHPPTRSESVRKRSASVISHVSNKSNRSSKRQKK